MGEQQLDQVTSDELVYVPAGEFRRLCGAGLPAADTADAFAALARINTLYMIARAWSGHIGTSFSSLEIMSWLFLNEIRDLDKGPGACDIFFSSKGHDAPALYSVLIGLGLLPEEKADHLRRLHGLPGHPHVETPYIQANTGSLGMGISKAKGMAIANRLAGHPRRIFVLTGDGELQEGQFWESLASAASRQLDEIVVIVDHNKIQSDTWVEQVSDLGDVEAKVRAFGWHVTRCDGHDVRAIEKTMRGLDRVVDRPKLVIADTVKGKGVSFMEGPTLKAGALYAYHSGAPTEAEYANGSKELLENAARLFTAGRPGSPRDEGRPTSGATRAARHTESHQCVQRRAAVAGRPPLRPRGARRGSREGLRPRALREEVSRSLRRVRDCRAGHGIDGMWAGPARRPPGRAFVCLFSVGQAERADLQPVQRGLQGNLCWFPCRSLTRRTRSFAPVGP